MCKSLPMHAGLLVSQRAQHMRRPINESSATESSIHVTWVRRTLASKQEPARRTWGRPSEGIFVTSPFTTQLTDAELQLPCRSEYGYSRNSGQKPFRICHWRQAEIQGAWRLDGGEPGVAEYSGVLFMVAYLQTHINRPSRQDCAWY